MCRIRVFADCLVGAYYSQRVCIPESTVTDVLDGSLKSLRESVVWLEIIKNTF